MVGAVCIVGVVRPKGLASHRERPLQGLAVFTILKDYRDAIGLLTTIRGLLRIYWRILFIASGLRMICS